MSAPPPVEPKPEKGKDRWTVLDVLRWTTGRFEERGLATPRLDAEILLGAALGISRVQLYVQFDRPLAPDELAAVRERVRRRQEGASVAYIVGRKEFFGLELSVDPRVLVPRPDTETLVDEALARLRANARPEPETVTEAYGYAETDAPRAGEPAAGPEPPLVTAAGEAAAAIDASAVAAEAGPGPRIADVGTGSGAIIIALGKHAAPRATLFAVDISPDALAVAAANATRHAVDVTFLLGDLATPLAAHAPFDLLVANLPYIPHGDLAGLAPEVRAEPALALDGGPDGLDLVRRLVTAAPPLLVPGGALALEIGAGQAHATAALMRDAGFTDVRLRRDLGTIERVVSGLKP